MPARLPDGGRRSTLTLPRGGNAASQGAGRDGFGDIGQGNDFNIVPVEELRNEREHDTSTRGQERDISARFRNPHGPSADRKVRRQFTSTGKSQEHEFAIPLAHS